MTGPTWRDPPALRCVCRGQLAVSREADRQEAFARLGSEVAQLASGGRVPDVDAVLPIGQGPLAVRREGERANVIVMPKTRRADPGDGPLGKRVAEEIHAWAGPRVGRGRRRGGGGSLFRGAFGDAPRRSRGPGDGGDEGEHQGSQAPELPRQEGAALTGQASYPSSDRSPGRGTEHGCRKVCRHSRAGTRCQPGGQEPGAQSQAAAGELLAQARAALFEAALQGAERTAEPAGGLILGQAFQAAKLHDPPGHFSGSRVRASFKELLRFAQTDLGQGVRRRPGRSEGFPRSAQRRCRPRSQATGGRQRRRSQPPTASRSRRVAALRASSRNVA